MKNSTDRGAVMQDIDKTLRWRLIAPMVTFVKGFKKEVQKQFSGANKKQMKALEGKLYANACKRGPAQWSRWYQANKKYQAQRTAMRRLGFKLNPEHNSLPRFAVW